MKIINETNIEVYWRIFGDDDTVYSLGLQGKEGTLKAGKSSNVDVPDFFQIEFREVTTFTPNAFNTHIVMPGAIYTNLGNLTLKNNKTIKQTIRIEDLPPHTHQNWMSSEIVQSKNLCEITLPATHDSGAYGLSKRVSADKSYGLGEDAKKWISLGSAGAKVVLFPAGGSGSVSLIVDQVINTMALAQSKSIIEQLNDGIRLLDLRVVKSGGQLNTAHGKVGVPISLIVDQIKWFLDQTSSELVVLMVSPGSTLDPSDIAGQSDSLFGIIESTFQDQIIYGNSNTTKTPIKELTKGRSRVLIITDEDTAKMTGAINRDKIGFSSTGRWAQASDINTLVEKCQEWVVKRQEVSDEMVSLSWVITPDSKPEVIASQVLAGKSLKTIAIEANGELDSFIKDSVNGKRINTIFTDFYEHSNAVEIAIKLSGLS